MMMISQDELAEVFSDVTPIPQDDGPNPVCSIDYSPEFIQAYDLMRAILKTGEKSERALRLTGLCLKLNPANYTIWHYRRQCLEETIRTNNNNIEQIIQQDLELAARLGGANPKNYQIWYHRRALLESAATAKWNNNNKTTTAAAAAANQEPPEETKTTTIGSTYVEAELEYVATVLEEDSKNYHAWSHRQWVVRTANDTTLWEKELLFAHSLIQKDPRNNSAWNQRWFVCHEGGSVKFLSLETAKKEADYAILGAGLDPYNESPWRYLIGILKEQCKVLGEGEGNDKKISLLDEYEGKAFGLRDELSNKGKNPDGCASLTSARIDILEFKGDAVSLEKAMELATGLASEHDPIRKKYWLLRVNQMKRVS